MQGQDTIVVASSPQIAHGLGLLLHGVRWNEQWAHEVVFNRTSTAMHLGQFACRPA
jgi:hypothetical protein